MKLSILLSSTLLFATVLSPMSAYADDQNLLCRRSGNECSSLRGNGNGKLSISGLDVNVKSSDRGNRNTRVSSNSNQNEVDNTADIDNNTNNNDNPVDADNDTNIENNGTNTENNTDIVAGGGTNTNPPQLNSNDIKGFDPFGGLYGPGT